MARWRVLRNTLHLLPENADKIVLACVALHNFIMRNDVNKIYCPQQFTDWEDDDQILHNGAWRNETQPLPTVANLRSNNSPRIAIDIRNILANYFINEGAVSFQYNK